MYLDEHKASQEAAVLAVVFDEDGYLTDQRVWTMELASRLAEEMSLPPLTEAHWQTIHFVRDNYGVVGGLPLMRHVCRSLGMRPHAIKGLFGGCRSLWRISGLPNPGEEARSYMD